MKEKYSIKLKENLNQLKEIFISIFPQDKKETLLLLALICFYFSYSIIIITNTVIVEGTHDRPYDLYFSFDNPSLLKSGIQNIEGHPLLVFFTRPIGFIGRTLADLFNAPLLNIFLVVFICNYMVASSVLYIYRYLNNIIQIKGYKLYLLTLFFACTSSCIILSFTFESFTFSLFFLSFMTYFYSSKIKDNSKTTLLSNIFFAITLGGITITNFVKGIIPLFFISEKRNVIIKRVIIISLSFFSILMYLEHRFHIFSSILLRVNTFTELQGRFYKKAIDLFWGSAILLPNLNISFNFYNKKDLSINMDFYHYGWQYLTVLSILLLVVYSIYKNRSYKLVQFLALSFLFDITLHLIIKYDINEAHIFAGHWIYIIPLLLGWLYPQASTRVAKAYTIVLTFISMIIIVNNFAELYRFINFAIELFPRTISNT